MLGNTERSRVVASMSPWKSCWNLTVWTIWESHLQSQKLCWEYQERGLLPLLVSISKQVQRNTKRQGMSWKRSVIRKFQRLLGSLKITLWKLWEEKDQTWAYWQLLLPSKTAWKLYDDIWWPQLARLPCNNENDWYETNSNLTNLFYGKELIKRVPSWQNFIVDLFYGRGEIKRHHRRQIFYGRRQTRMRLQEYEQTKRRKEWGRVGGIFSYRWSAELF